MTVQQSNILINESNVDLGWLDPYFVRHDDNTDAFPVSPNLPESSVRCSALWRGYIATMRLHADYRLELEYFDFPFAGDAPLQTCNSYFTGDFSITFRPFFFGPNTIVPFRDGAIVRDRSEWHIDDQTLEGVVKSVAYDPHTKKPLGLHLDISRPAFAPQSLVPVDFRDDLHTIVGRTVSCQIAQGDDEGGCIIVQIDRVAEG
jgi:hypothetical protein